MLSSVGFICLLPMHVANELYSKSNIIRIGAFLFFFLFLFFLFSNISSDRTRRKVSHCNEKDC